MKVVARCIITLFGLWLAACSLVDGSHNVQLDARVTQQAVAPSTTHTPSGTPSPTPSPTAAATHTPSATPTASITPSPTPTPTYQYPLALNTPIPGDLPSIGVDNLSDLAGLAQWGDGQVIELHHFQEVPWLAVVFDDGLRVYDGASLEELYWLPGSIPQGGNPVYSYFAFSPDGRIFALLEGWGTLKVWGLEDGELMLEEKIWEGVGCIQRPVVSPSHNSVAIIGGCDYNEEESRVTLIRIPDGRRIVSDQADQGGFSADGRYLVTLLDRSQKVSVWDTASGDLVYEIATGDNIRCSIVYSWRDMNWQMPPVPGTHNQLDCFAVSPDSRVLAVSTNSVLEVWDLAGGELIKKINGSARPWFTRDGSFLVGTHWAASRNIALYETVGFSQTAYLGNRVSETVSPSGQYITSSEFHLIEMGLYETRGLVVQDVVNQRRVASFPDSYRVEFSGDEAYLALYISEFSDQPKVVKAVSTADGSVVLDLPGETHPVFHPDGKTLITSNGSQVSFWDLVEGTLIRTMDGAYPVVLADGQSVAVMGVGVLFTANPGEGELGLEAPFPISPESVAFTADGKMLVERSLAGTRLVDLETLQPLGSFAGGVAFNRDGSRYAQAGGDKVGVYNVAGGKPVCELAVEGPSGLLFSPAADLLAVSHAPRDLTLWDLSTCQLLHKLSSDGRLVYQMAFTPDGRTLFAVAKPNMRGDRRDIYKWEVDTGQLLSSRSYLCNGNIPLKVSGDGRYLIYGANGCALRVADTQYLSDLWTLSLGERVRTIQADISHDGSLLVTTHEDNAIRFWDIAQQSEIKFIDPNSEDKLSRSIFDVTMSPDGRSLAVVGEGSVQLLGIFEDAKGKSGFSAIETPTPIPPKDPVPGIPIFDDFSGTAYNTFLWQRPDPQIAKLYQYGPKDGVFEVRKKNVDEEGGFIQFRTQYYLPIDPVRVYELRFQVPVIGNGKGASLWLDIAGGLPNTQWWENRCTISALTTTHPIARCAVGGIKSGTDEHFIEYEFDLFPQGETFQYGQWYTLRYEFDQNTGTLYYFLDNRLIQVYQPKDAQVLKRTEFSMNIAMWVDTQTSFYAWFDDVRINR